MHRPPEVTLIAFTADLLPAVHPWFEHAEVRRWLGGPDWPERELRVLDTTRPGEVFRGRRVLRAYSWVVLDAVGAPVAKVGGDLYDRWSRAGRGEPGPAFGLGYVVDPGRWRRGYGLAALRAALAHPDLADVRVFAAGIDADNVASRRCAAAAGFAPDDPEPDHEDIVYYLRRVSSRSSTPVTSR